MVVDSSAIVAILTGEPEASALLAAAEAAERLFTSPIVLFETAMALRRVFGVSAAQAERDVTEFLAAARMEVVPIDQAAAKLAQEAAARFGKGGGSPAQLNMGDCFVYALARAQGAPLLFKGDDFRHTDVLSAL